MSTTDSPGLFVGDDASQNSDDSISLTSTQLEEEQSEYCVDRILCEGERDDGETVWLGP